MRTWYEILSGKHEGRDHFGQISIVIEKHHFSVSGENCFDMFLHVQQVLYNIYVCVNVQSLNRTVLCLKVSN